MPAFPTDLRFARTEEQLSCDLDDEIAILNPASKLYFGLTGVGATIWRALESPRSLDEIIAAVRNQYDVEADQCRTDVSEFLSELQQRGLVQAQDTAG